ncbi:MAG: DUF861 domain-containing protein [Actinobacteria bacterium]|nr:DUF861 domain-containing protein [Actinomycetota bacterium]
MNSEGITDIQGAIAAIAVSSDELQDIELQVKGPRDPAFEGTPVESMHRFYDDGRTLIGIWECTPGRFPVSKPDSTSTMYFFSGAGSITDENGESHPIIPGSAFVEPEGWRGEWTITETVRKLYVITRGPSADRGRAGG